MHSAPLHILLTQKLTDEQQARVRALAPKARILGDADLAAEPGLEGRIEICFPRLPQGMWHRATGLRWLQSDMAGVDSLLKLADAKAHPAVITNVHIHRNCVAEHLWGMTLMLTRNLHHAVLQQSQGTWNSAPLSQGLSTLAGKTLCIVGLGAIGERCAELGRALGMHVVGIRRTLQPSAAAHEVLGLDARMEVFTRSRVIMLLLPDTPETKGVVGQAEMDVMQGAFLLNGGRGSSVDTEALVEALRKGTVRGAGLDVTDPEPLPQGHPLWGMPNVIMTPHYAGVHPGYAEEAFETFVANLGRWMKGEPLQNVVDKTRGY